MRAMILRWLHKPATSGIFIFLAAVAAMMVANSDWSHLYDGFLNIQVVVQFGALKIDKPFLLWINDGLMAIFFLQVGLELKREFLEGQLAKPANVILPVIGAVGGIVVPALIYAVINHADPAALQGWAIPTATDISFALGILALLGKRVPAALKLFLLTLAIIDDLVAIVIIALFYTSDLGMGAFTIAGGALSVLMIMNVMGHRGIAAYGLVGVVLWVALLKSGVHATLAGVVIAMAIPLKGAEGTPSPLHQLETDLHFLVALAILPLFAFANAGISLTGLSPSVMLQPVPLGIFLGLFIGKQLGVFSFVWGSVRMGLVKKPESLAWWQLYGVAVLCGVGFTMSLFVSTLAFEHAQAVASMPPDMGSARLGILVGSMTSGVLGWLILLFVLPKTTEKNMESPG
ncbi:MAG: Na+/H+ antiporter NhaA [Magnetococcales bacterium]|nr:Na+/H+ antiporter NhaA [Magnetococcales bacterium]